MAWKVGAVGCRTLHRHKKKDDKEASVGGYLKPDSRMQAYQLDNSHMIKYPHFYHLLLACYRNTLLSVYLTSRDATY